MTAGNHSDQRLPDFLIIGTMKSGTTALFRWLGELTDVALPEVKEPCYFSNEKAWNSGVRRYTSLFAHVPPGYLTGEASVEYTDPVVAGKAASRILALLPDIKLICVLRDPIERMRSHYRHEVQRSRERQHFQTAIQAANNPYVRRSMYLTSLSPYLDRFGGDQICVVRMEDLIEPPYPAWYEILAHIGAAKSEPLGVSINVTSQKKQFTKAGLLLWERGILASVAARMPRGIRRLGGKILLRDNLRYRDLMQTSEQAVPETVSAPILRDANELQDRLGIALGFENAK